jgi:hydrogenase maturation protease
MSARRVLVAGIGNVFLGDDGFGVEVVSRLAQRPQPEGVEVADFGIRGFDLAYALMDGYDLAVLVDALPLGKPAGTVSVIEPDLDGHDAEGGFDSHGMNPMEVFRLVKHFGGRPPPVLIVGCEPESLGAENEGRMGLSDRVSGSVDDAVQVVSDLLAREAV